MATELTASARDHLDKLPARSIVEYLIGRFGPEPGTKLAERAAAGETLPPGSRSLLELAGQRLDMVDGHWRLEAYFHDGHLRKISRHHMSISATTGLDRFDADVDVGVP